jgi:hypothetical protein
MLGMHQKDRPESKPLIDLLVAKLLPCRRGNFLGFHMSTHESRHFDGSHCSLIFLPLSLIEPMLNPYLEVSVVD